MTVIVTKNSSTASAVPLTSDLVQGELAVNVTDKRIFTENASTAIVELGTNPSTITTATATVSGVLTANGTLASSNAVLTGGTINSTPIGATTPSTIVGSTVTASTGFVGGLTGDVIGNVTGNVTGNITGDITGDVTGNVTAATGTTTLNNLVVNGTVDFTDTKLTNLATPTAATDAATKGYVDTVVSDVINAAPAALDTLNELAAALGDDANFSTTVTNSIATRLPLAGGTMSGAIAMGTSKITGLGDPTGTQDAATKAYVDAADSTGLSLSGGTMSGAIAMGTNKITGLGTPTDAADATTKAYTDSILGSATSAADSAAAASTSASNASTSASNAASSATAASGSATAANLSATNAAASYDSFDDRYLGAKASNPTVDNDGDALIAGATYFNTTADSMKVYSGSAWSDVAPVATAVTLSQVTDFPTQSGQSGKFLTTNGAVPNWVTLITDPTLGTLTKTFTNSESASISLTSSVLAPVVSVTKEVPQTGVTNNSWDVSSTTENYTRLDSAPATTLSFNAIGHAIETAVLNHSYSIAYAQEPSVEDMKFNTDGTKMFIVGESGDKVNEYDLSTAFDISTLSFSRDFSVASQDNRPQGLFFNANGTKMFVVGLQGDKVYEYSLSTGFNLSTAAYTQFFSISAQEVNPTGLAFNTDGTTMFVVGSSGDKVYEYTLSTGFDISTASFVDSFSTSGQTAVPKGIAFTPDGTKMFIASAHLQDVFMYNLTTGFDVSTASYSGTSFGLSNTFETTGITFNNDGSKMYITDSFNDKIHEYNLTLANALGLGTGSFASADVGKTLEANSGEFVLTATDGSYVETTAPTSYAQVASGDWSMYGVVYDATTGVLKISNYTDVNSYFDLSTAAYSQSFSLAAQETNPAQIAFNTDGTKMFVVGFTGDDVNEYILSTAFDISTASFVDSFSVAAQETQPTSLAFNTDGTKMFVAGFTGDNVNEYTLSTGFDVSTASFVDSFYVGGQETIPIGIAFNTDGTKLFVCGNTGNDINEYSLSTGFDVSTASFVDSVSVVGQDSNPTGVAFNTDGTRMFVVGDSNASVYQYTLSTGFDVSTASYSKTFSVTTQTVAPQGIAFNNDGSKMFVVEYGTDSVLEYTMGSLYFSTGSRS